MKLNASQLAVLSTLSDEWLDLPEHLRSQWRIDVGRRHPALAHAIGVMVDAGAQSLVPPELTQSQTELDHESSEFSPGSLIGPYRLLKPLGRGGMGDVWLAEQSSEFINRTVALKLPLAHMAQRGLRARFARERDILAALDHPGIAKMFDAGVTDDGQPYMAMQYVSGNAVTVHSDQYRLSVTARVMLFIELLDAVQHAHSNLVVHRDLKPSNILVTDGGRVMLLDFGIAKLLEISPGSSSSNDGPAQTEFAASAFTLDYASPEQVSNKTVSTRSDIYSLGVVLYELLAGKRPYHLRRQSRAAIEEAVLEQDIKAPSGQIEERFAALRGSHRRALSKQLKGDLDAIVLKAMSKNPESRYATAQALAEDLQRWQRKEPVLAQPDSLGYRTRRLVVRNWRAIAAAGLLAAVLITTATVAVVKALEAQHSALLARDEARKEQAVSAFLKDLFNNNTLNQADPEAARKRTSLQLLDDGAARIQTQLKGMPEQQIELLHMMIELYFGLRLPERAVEFAQQAATIAQAAYGPADPRSIAETAAIARFGFSGNSPKEAALALEKVRPELGRLMASDDVAYRRAAARILDAQLIEQIYFARVRESLQTARTAEKLYATMPAGEMEANVHHSMGTIYWRNLAFADAERHFSESDRLQEAAHAREGETYPALHGMLLALMGRYQEAEAKFVVAHAMERHNDAGGNRTADWVLSAYARFLCSTSRPREALALAQTGGPDASEIIREGLKTAPRTLLVKGEALIRMGPVEEGLIDIDRADGLALVKFGARAAAQGLPSERTLAMLELGNLAQAEPLIDRAEKMLGAMQADAGVPSRVFWRYRISLLLAQGKLQQARAVLERVRGVLLPADAGLAEAAMVDWLEAGIEQQEGNAVGARRRLESALARIAASPDRTWLREWEAKLQESLGVSLVALGLSSDGQHSFEAALDNYKAFLDPKTSLSVGRVAHRLATLHRQAGRFDHAKHWQSMADDVRRQHPMFEQWVL